MQPVQEQSKSDTDSHTIKARGVRESPARGVLPRTTNKGNSRLGDPVSAAFALATGRRLDSRILRDTVRAVTQSRFRNSLVKHAQTGHQVCPRGLDWTLGPADARMAGYRM